MPANLRCTCSPLCSTVRQLQKLCCDRLKLATDAVCHMQRLADVEVLITFLSTSNFIAFAKHRPCAMPSSSIQLLWLLHKCYDFFSKCMNATSLSYTCAFKPGCLLTHNRLHTPDCSISNDIKSSLYRWMWASWITTTTCPSSSMGWGKHSSPTSSWQWKGWRTCWRQEAAKSCQSFPNSSFPSRLPSTQGTQR